MTALTMMMLPTIFGMGILCSTRATVMDFGVNITLRSSCKLSANVRSYHMNCMCDDMCHTYGDCCEDKQNKPNTNEPAVPSILQESISHMTCVNDSRIERRFPVYILQKCVKYFPDAKIKDKCEKISELSQNQLQNMFLNQPVTGLQSGILYKNSYCALCNNENIFDLWSVNISSNNREILDVVSKNALKMNWKAISNLTYMVEYSHPIFKGHMCKNPISKCSATWPDDDIERACSQEPANFVYRGNTYKNIHCARCNGVKRDDYYLTRLDVKGFLHMNNPAIPGPPSFSTLLNLTSNLVTTEERVDEGRWVTRERVMDVHNKEGQVYDPFTHEYQVLSCLPTQVMEDARCVSAMEAAVRCPMETIIRFQMSEFEYLQNKSVSIFSLQSVYPQEEYWSDGINVLICNQTYTSLEQFISQHPVHGYASLALLGLSFLCIVLQLVVHCCRFPRPRKMLALMFLGASLLGAAVLTSIGYIGLAYLWFGGPKGVLLLIPGAILLLSGIFYVPGLVHWYRELHSCRQRSTGEDSGNQCTGLVTRDFQFTLYIMQAVILWLTLLLFYVCIQMPNMSCWYASVALNVLHILATFGLFCNWRRDDHPITEGEKSENDDPGVYESLVMKTM